MRILRWKAILPLLLLLCLFAVVWVLLLDSLVARSVEVVGADIVGARVDVESADVNLTEGRVSIRGMQAANPDSPMRNLVEAEELVADIRVKSLLRKKVVIEQLSARGVRFGTERTTSGELEDPSPESGALLRRISGWAEQVRIPELSLEGLGQAVNIDALSLDSLRTPALALAAVSLADSSRRVWEAGLVRLNPLPLADSARNLVQRLNSANPLTLGISGTRDLAESARSTLSSVRDLEAGIGALDSTVRTGIGRLQQQVQQLAASREADFRYATRLLRLPSLDSPDVSPNLFGELAVARMQRVMYWLGKAERYLPPGLNPRRFAGSKRARMAGTDVRFPAAADDPDFLIESADADLEIGGRGAAAGQYAARLIGFTNQPAVYGRPLQFFVERAGGVVGPSDIRVAAVIDHVGESLRDSLFARMTGVSLPNIELRALGANLNMGNVSSEIQFMRQGDSISGSWKWSSNSVEWNRIGTADTQAAITGQGGNVQVGRMARDFLWRAVSNLREVEVEVRFSGSSRGPSLAIGSNVGRAVAQSLRQELGREIDRAQQRVRAEVDRLVSDGVNEARQRVDSLQSEVGERIGLQYDEVAAVRQELERAIRRLVPGR